MKTEQKTSSQNLGNLFGAMAKAQGDFNPIKRTAKGHWGKYSDLNDIYEATRKQLSKNNISVMQSVCDGGVTTVVGHESGEHMIFETTWTKQSASKLLMLGGGWTLMRRYALQAVLNVCGDDDAEKKIEIEGSIVLDQYSAMEEALDLIESLNSKDINSPDTFLNWRNSNSVDIARLSKEKEVRKVIIEAVEKKKLTFGKGE